MKKGKDKRKTNTNLFAAIVFIIIGGICGFFGGMFIAKNFKGSGSEKTELLALLVFFIFLYLVAFLQIIIHEGGHLIFGKLSGYQFVSFRVASFMLMSDHGRLKLKRYKLKGTGGQCLMMPPEVTEEYEYSYTLYNLGGVLNNIIFSILGLLLFITLPANNYMSLFLIVFFLIGILFAIVNGVPMKLSGIANDGHNLMSIKKDKEARRAFWLMLQTNALLAEGKRLKDMPAEWFELKQEMELINPIICFIGVLRCSYLHDLKQFHEAQTLCEWMINDAPGILELHKNELRCELMFYEIIDMNREDVIESLYTKELKKYIKITSSFVSRKRLMYAYELLVKHNSEEAKKQLAAFEKTAKTYPYSSEIEGERELLELINEKAKL